MIKLIALSLSVAFLLLSFPAGAKPQSLEPVAQESLIPLRNFQWQQTPIPLVPLGIFQRGQFCELRIWKF